VINASETAGLARTLYSTLLTSEKLSWSIAFIESVELSAKVILKVPDVLCRVLISELGGQALA
jgi:hypothetical protein